MKTTRRDFLKVSAAAGGVLGLGLGGCSAGADQPDPLRILILGGTGFIGPHMVRFARQRGHSVTLFNRGRTNTHLFPDVEKLVGDRDGNLQALEGREWDAVLDNSGYVPRHVRDSAQLLKDRVGQYLFISSVSAYKDFAQPGIDEEYPGGTLDDPTVEQVNGETYGPLKVLCEQAVQEIYQATATVVRPGYIVGPGDSTDRWTYWPVRVERGGEMLAPGTSNDPVQIIDARDLAGFVVRALENKVGGVYNAVGPANRLSMGAMLDSAKATSGADVRFTWVGADFLREKQVSFPIWTSPAGDMAGLLQVSNARALANGMTYRPLTETIRDTLEWWKTLDEERRSQMRSGLRAPPALPFGPASMAVQMEQEDGLLQAWHAHAA